VCCQKHIPIVPDVRNESDTYLATGITQSDGARMPHALPVYRKLGRAILALHLNMLAIGTGLHVYALYILAILGWQHPVHMHTTLHLFG
jgi:hypothetical protein